MIKFRCNPPLSDCSYHGINLRHGSTQILSETLEGIDHYSVNLGRVSTFELLLRLERGLRSINMQ